MNLRDLEYLTAVADQRSFRKAATACGVSQPTLSIQIHKLEDELGALLVDRSAAPVALTALGAEVVVRAREVLRGIADIRALAADATGAPSDVRLGVFPTLGPYLMPRVLSAVREALPTVRVLLTERRTAALLAMLDAGELDAALVALPVDDPRLGAIPLFREEFLLAAPAAPNRASQGEAGGPWEEFPIATAELERLITLSEGHCLADQVRDWAHEHGVSLRSDYRATSLESLRQMVSAGEGTTLLPALAVLEPVPAFPGIALRRFAEEAPARTIALVHPLASPRIPTLRTLAKALVPAVETPTGGRPLIAPLPLDD